MTGDTTRRQMLGWTLCGLIPAGAAGTETHQATGVKVGEITPTSTRIWARRTRLSRRRADGVPARRVKPEPMKLPVDTAALEGACPGAEGELRLVVERSGGKRVFESGWKAVGPSADFTHQFDARGLHPSTEYRFTVETRAGRRTDGALRGAFRTAPPADSPVAVNLAMLSCQKYSQRDDERGFLLYDAIRQWRPDFYLSVGDNVYYDSDDPVVNSTGVARHHWHRMFSLPRIVECLRTVPGYWLKDDHDCYSDDCWPGKVTEKMTPFTFEEGLRVFPEQAPIGPKPYRRFRWGRGLEVWLLEGRDYRTANLLPDSPEKSIWGVEQKKWLLESLSASDAHWKLIVSPTPVVGPDRPNKQDNHSNHVFTAEGNEFRRWLSANRRGDTFVLCGDRHWQYHSVDPSTKVEEFGCGAASDSHAGGTPGENPGMHRFHRVKGGFLAVQVRPESGGSRLVIEHRDVLGNHVYRSEYHKAT